jgi:hypothetical protein
MNIRNQLAGMDEEIPEKRIVAQIYISLSSEYDPLIKVIKFGPREQQTLDIVINTLMEEENSKIIRSLLTMLAAHLHPDQHLQLIHIIVVEDAEVAEVECEDVVVTKEPTIPKVVRVAIAIEEFRNRTTGTVGTIVFVGTRCQNIRNYNMNNRNRNANRVKTKSIMISQIHVPRVVCQL